MIEMSEKKALVKFGKRAIGASALDAPGTGLAEFEIQYPFMDDATAA